MAAGTASPRGLHWLCNLSRKECWCGTAPAAKIGNHHILGDRKPSNRPTMIGRSSFEQV